ncbi:MAG: hypothetical protein ACOX0M_03300 [Salinivirgaceae bacterium]|jgi:outer membrane protein assembly factor BamA|nr:hypothetical protein [Bacteroidales bacterium]
MCYKTISRVITLLLLFLSFFSKAQIIEDVVIDNNEVTENWIITRELLVNKGDTINSNLFEKLKRSEENLYNTSLFNEIRVVDTVINNQNVIYVYVAERWYFWPYPILEHADRNLATFIHSKEWDRINYGIMIMKHNFRGRKEDLGFKCRLGFRQQFGLNYYIPMINKNNQKLGLYFDLSMFRQKSFLYDIDSLRYKFHDFENYGYRESRFIGGLIYRPEHNITHSVLGTFNRFSINDTITQVSLPLYGNKTKTNNWFYVDYNFVYSTLNYIYYPTSGQKLQISLAAGTDFDVNSWKNILTNYQLHIPFDYNLTYSSSYFGETFFDKLPPVGLRKNIGDNYYFRGYEDNIWKAHSVIGSRQQLSWNFFKKRGYQIQYIASNKFNKPFLSVYATMFSDFGYIYKIKPDNNNMILWSLGSGIDFVSYYDVIVRFEFALNMNINCSFNIHLGTTF